MTTSPETEPPPDTCRLRDLVGYFLRLGTLGFGGPIALAGYMQRDLVERRRWYRASEFKQGLALAQLAPGPLAAELAIYLGWVRFRLRGATAVAIAFVLPSFLMVLGLAAAYVELGGLPWLAGLFYGIGAAVIAIIARSAVKLVKMSIGRDRVLWAIFAASALTTAWTEQEIIWQFLASGFAVMAMRGWRPGAKAAGFAPWLVTGLHGAVGGGTLVTLGLYFAAAGTFVFGSGLAIVPFLHGGVVDQHHWLTERQFLDAVAVAMITPGPVVITVAFIGYLVAGPIGATVSAAGVFAPAYLAMVIPAPYFHRFADNRHVKAFVDGVTAAATGAIAGAAFVLGRRAIIDVPTVLILLAVLAVQWRLRKIPEPIVILAAGAVGLAIQSVAG
jgi:chromate transporter